MVYGDGCKGNYQTVVCARAVVASGARLGPGCIVSSGAAIDRYVVLPAGTHVDCGQVVQNGPDVKKDA